MTIQRRFPDSLTQSLTWLIMAAALAAVAVLLATPGVVWGQDEPTITLSATDTVVAENVGSVTVTMTLAHAPSSGIYTGCGVRGISGNSGTATETDDYTLPVNDKSLSNAALSVGVNLNIVDDSIDDDNETIIIEGYCNGSEGTPTPDHTGLTSGTVTLTITDNDNPNNQPSFPSAETVARAIDENSGAGANVGAPVSANDSDSGETLIYTLVGADAASFTIDNTGQIKVVMQTQLNYEAKSEYTFDVQVSDNKADNGSADTAIDDTQTVAITVNNVDEPGVVTLAPNTAPKVGVQIIASLSDPDGGVSGEIWQWQTEPDGTETWTDITGATYAGYTPLEVDVGKLLRATTSYTDAHASAKSATSNSTAAVASQAAPAPTNLRATTGDGQVRLSWDSAADTTITGYEYQKDNGNWMVVPGDATAASVVVTGLGDGQSYIFKVRAMRGAVAGNPASVTVALTVTCTPDDVRVQQSKAVPSDAFVLTSAFAGNCRPAGFTDAIFGSSARRHRRADGLR